MKIERFGDIIAWQKAKVLTLEIYTRFRESKDFEFAHKIPQKSSLDE